MVTGDVLKVLKLHSPTARAILRTFKTSLVPINHEMHSRSYDFLYVLHSTNTFLLLTYSRNDNNELLATSNKQGKTSYNYLRMEGL